jgi:hypothetical protein
MAPSRRRAPGFPKEITRGARPRGATAIAAAHKIDNVVAPAIAID